MKKYTIVLLLLIAACSGKKVVIKDFNNEIWKQDKLGCKDLRSDLYKILLDNKQLLLGLRETELIDFLGRPDQTELYTRNQKFYFYQLSPGPQCGDTYADREPARLSFRFNATGLVNEITLYN